MKIAEARALTDREITEKKGELRKEILNLRLQQTTGQLEKPSRLRELRRAVAKLETALAEKRKGTAPATKEKTA